MRIISSIEIELVYLFVFFHFRIYQKISTMNGNNNHSNNSMCNQNQIPKNLPLKKRRAYIIDPPTIDQDETYFNYQSTTIQQ